jgi:ligand-binding sensor domain-containing protein
MKRSLQLVVLVLLILTKNNSGFSQQIKFNKVVSPIGSFSGFVGGIVQDKNGFMWFATGAGLYKYDGYRFKTYTNDPSNNNSLSTNRLETVYTDLNGMIWIFETCLF